MYFNSENYLKKKSSWTPLQVPGKEPVTLDLNPWNGPLAPDQPTEAPKNTLPPRKPGGFDKVEFEPVDFKPWKGK